MHYHFQFGEYVPCYLLIVLATKDPITNIKTLDHESQRTFVHEYTHFLQNISTTFGLSNIWNTYDRSRQLISNLQKSNEDVMAFPLKGSAVDNQLRFFKIRRALEGSYHLKEIQDKSAKVIKVECYRDTDYDAEYPDTGLEFVKLTLQDKGGNNEVFLFGESAVSETMAWLMESKYFSEKELYQYPYQACRHLGEYLGSPITKNDEWLFALCDTCLLSDYPGYMFYLILKDMKKRNWTPVDAKDIYKYGIDFIQQKGWDVWGNLTQNFKGSIIVLKELYDHPLFHPTLTWFTETLNKAYGLRFDNVSFMLDLYREKQVFEGYWNEIFQLLGTPQLHNGDAKRYFIPTPEFRAKEASIDPIFLLALRQIQNLILVGKSKRSCALKEFCDQNTNGLKTDERCEETPWERAKDKQTCAYGALWAVYGFKGKVVTFE